LLGCTCSLPGRASGVTCATAQIWSNQATPAAVPRQLGCGPARKGGTRTGKTPVGVGGGLDAPTGVTGRVGAGLSRPGLPRDEARFFHVDWATTPQAAPQSLDMTPECSQMVARCCEKGSKAPVGHART
jgi:hypothetical protein